MPNVSFVAMTWNRGGVRVRNLLDSVLVRQTRPAAECIIVDTSNDPAVVRDIAATCRQYEHAQLIRLPQDTLEKSWALNVGIQAVDPFSRWVATIDIDFMFGPRLVEMIMSVPPHKQTLIIVQPMRLPKDADLSDPFEPSNWRDLCLSATWWGDAGGPGALQCADRGWWYRVRGYDERFTGGLGGLDLDVVERAMRDNLSVICLPFDSSRALHQWHEPSPLKGITQHLLNKDNPVMANPDGWGEL